MQGYSGNIVEVEWAPEPPNSEKIKVEQTGNVVHVSGEGSNWTAWLNTDNADFDGICVAFGTSRDECFEQMIQLFENVLSKVIVARGKP